VTPPQKYVRQPSNEALNHHEGEQEKGCGKYDEYDVHFTHPLKLKAQNVAEKKCCNTPAERSRRHYKKCAIWHAHARGNTLVANKRTAFASQQLRDTARFAYCGSDTGRIYVSTVHRCLAAIAVEKRAGCA
jgi:hypothetical protein